MTYRVRVRRAAELDIASAIEWYESQQVGLASEFLDEFEKIMAYLGSEPRMFPEKYRGVRRAVLHRFPYLVWYRIDALHVDILACTHCKVDPDSIPDQIS
ncbi:MAG: type II toxin-antitoxin system RelE/ParE family toxin [Oceanococcaceae bacterium]